MKYLVLFLLAVSSIFFAFDLPTKEEAPVEQESIKWYSWEEAVELNRSNPKKIFIDIYTDWCGWCKKMDASTFKNPVIVKILNDDYYPVKLNAERKDTVVAGGKTYTYVKPPNSRRGYHELAAALLNGKMSYPTFVVLNESFNMLSPIPGYQSPQNLEPMLEYYAGEHYKSTNWTTYHENFKSSIPAAEN